MNKNGLKLWGTVALVLGVIISLFEGIALPVSQALGFLPEYLWQTLAVGFAAAVLTGVVVFLLSMSSNMEIRITPDAKV